MWIGGSILSLRSQSRGFQLLVGTPVAVSGLSDTWALREDSFQRLFHMSVQLCFLVVPRIPLCTKTVALRSNVFLLFFETGFLYVPRR